MEHLAFWIVALGMALAVAVLLILSLRGAARHAPADDSAAPQDRRIYRDQLAEVDRDIARGTLTAAEGQRLRTEIARRLLEADRNTTARRAGPLRLGAPMLLILAVLVPGMALVYAGFGPGRPGLGAPGYPDLPLAERIAAADQRLAGRPAQAEAESRQPPWVQPELDADYLALITRLRAAVDPASATDAEGLRLLAMNEARLGNFATAKAAQARRLAVLGDGAAAADHAALADMLIGAAGGYVSPEAEAELVAALQLDPAEPLARYYSGLLFAQGGRYDRAFALWQPLAAEGAADAPWMPALRADLPQVADLAGVAYILPALRGPSAEDVAASADLSDADRAAMIEGMVASLSDRLATTGGTAAEWAQLIGALGVLGRKEEAAAIWAEAQGIFADAPADLQELTRAAKAAGLAP